MTTPAAYREASPNAGSLGVPEFTTATVAELAADQALSVPNRAYAPCGDVQQFSPPWPSRVVRIMGRLLVVETRPIVVYGVSLGILTAATYALWNSPTASHDLGFAPWLGAVLGIGLYAGIAPIAVAPLVLWRAIAMRDASGKWLVGESLPILWARRREHAVAVAVARGVRTDTEEFQRVRAGLPGAYAACVARSQPVLLIEREPGRVVWISIPESLASELSEPFRAGRSPIVLVTTAPDGRHGAPGLTE